MTLFAPKKHRWLFRVCAPVDVSVRFCVCAVFVRARSHTRALAGSRAQINRHPVSAASCGLSAYLPSHTVSLLLRTTRCEITSIWPFKKIVRKRRKRGKLPRPRLQRPPPGSWRYCAHVL